MAFEKSWIEPLPAAEIRNSWRASSSLTKTYKPRVLGAPMSESLMITLRNYADADAAALLDLYRHTIRTINCRDYNSVQIAAWASDAIELEPWHARFHNRFAYVAQLQNQTVGFADMDTSGYLDRLFVSAAHQRQGIAQLLLRRFIADAQTAEIATITTEASITARPFFESSGFKVLQQQTVPCRGAWLTNYRMRLEIEPRSNSCSVAK